MFNVTSQGISANINITLCLNGHGALSCENYDVSALDLNISTTERTHIYPSIGIKINTPGFTLSGCTPISNGYCLFSASRTNPAVISLNDTSTFTVGGTIASLTGTITMQNNGADSIQLNSNGNFTFPTPLNTGSAYAVTITSQPTGQTCTLTNASGVIQNADVSNVTVTCNSNMAYMANSSNNTISICNIGLNGVLDSCTTNTDATFNNLGDVVLNSQANIAYVLNQTTVSVCSLDSNGQITGSCTSATPGGNFTYGGIYPTQSILYISDWGNNRIFTCTIKSDGSLETPCSTSNGEGTISGPVGRIGINSVNNIAYIPNWNSNTVSICSIKSDGSFENCSTSSGNSTINRREGVTLNPLGTVLYVINLNNTVSVCPINSSDGSLGTCVLESGNGTFNFADTGINSFVSNKDFAYIPNSNAGTNLSICPTQQDGTFGTCVTNTGDSTLNGVVSTWISFN